MVSLSVRCLWCSRQVKPLFKPAFITSPNVRQYNNQMAKLYYFDGRGVAEPIRLILKYGGMEFEDLRVASMDTIPPVCPPDIQRTKCTWGQLPVMEFEGKKLTQSVAMARYFAKRFKLVPKDDYEAALCDEYVDAIRDFMGAWVPVGMEADPKAREKLIMNTYDLTKKKFLDVFESIIKSNGGKHLVGNSLTWADIYVAYVLDHLETILKTSLTKNNPAVKAMSDNVYSIPPIKAWVESRPKTLF